MILYVNGDSHTAAAEAVNSCAFAEDDNRYFYMGRHPHPENLSVSWGKRLSESLKSTFKCDAESASSNHRIIRTSREWLAQQSNRYSELLVVIQWSTWERQEWLIQGRYWQVNASGIDDVPNSHKDEYRQWIEKIDWGQSTNQNHDMIWDFHNELNDKGVRHIFFNGNTHFENIPKKQRHDWGNCYIDPYDSKMTWNQWLLDHGFDTVSPKSYHFGQEAHGAWARFMLNYIVKNKLLT